MGETFVFHWNCKYPPLRLHLTTGYQCKHRERDTILFFWALGLRPLLLLIRFEFQRKVNETKSSAPREWMMVVIECKECVAAVMDSTVCTFVQIPTSPSGMETILMGTICNQLTLDFEIQPCPPACLSACPILLYLCPLQLLCNVRNKNSLRHTVTYVKWAFIRLTLRGTSPQTELIVVPHK